jgi:hypothetical protein
MLLLAAGATTTTTSRSSNRWALDEPVDPLGAVLESELATAQTDGVELGIKIACGCIVGVVCLVYWWFRRSHKSNLREADLFYDEAHYLPKVDDTRTRRPTALGGLCSALVFIIVITLVSLSLIDYVRRPTLVQSVTPPTVAAAARSPRGEFAFSVCFIGISQTSDTCSSSHFAVSLPGKDQMNVFGLLDVSLVSNENQNQQCCMEWSCSDCVVASSDPLKFELGLRGEQGVAALSFHVRLPAYSHDKHHVPFSLSGTVVPDVPLHTVFKGSAAPTTISLTLMPVIVTTASNEVSVGSRGSIDAVLLGSQINATSWSSFTDGAADASGSGTSVVFEMNLSNLDSQVVLTRGDLLGLIARVGALAGTVVTVLRIVMNVFERDCIRHPRRLLSLFSACCLYCKHCCCCNHQQQKSVGSPTSQIPLTTIC